MTHEDEEKMTVPEGAEYLGVAASTLYRWIDRHALEATTTPGGRIEVRKADLDALATRMATMRRNVRRAEGN